MLEVTCCNTFAWIRKNRRFGRFGWRRIYLPGAVFSLSPSVFVLLLFTPSPPPPSPPLTSPRLMISQPSCPLTQSSPGPRQSWLRKGILALLTQQGKVSGKSENVNFQPLCWFQAGYCCCQEQASSQEERWAATAASWSNSCVTQPKAASNQFFFLHQHSAPQSIASPSFVFTSCDRSSCQYDQLYSHIGHSCIPMNYATNLDSCSLGQSAPLVLLASPEIQLCNPSYWLHHHPDYFRHSTAAGAPSSMF